MRTFLAHASLFDIQLMKKKINEKTNENEKTLIRNKINLY